MRWLPTSDTIFKKSFFDFSENFYKSHWYLVGFCEKFYFILGFIVVNSKLNFLYLSNFTTVEQYWSRRVWISYTVLKDQILLDSSYQDFRCHLFCVVLCSYPQFKLVFQLEKYFIVFKKITKPNNDIVIKIVDYEEVYWNFFLRITKWNNCQSLLRYICLFTFRNKNLHCFFNFLKIEIEILAWAVEIIL